MTARLLALTCVIASLSAGSAVSDAAAPRTPDGNVQLSPDLLSLLRAEMLGISAGVQGIPVSLATADWQAIQATSENIRASYIMEKQLTPAQAEELERALPEGFKRLDAAFHQRAEKLGAAAAAHDPELTAFHFSRLVEICAQCHAAYAQSRFPGFAGDHPPAHQH